MSKPQLYVCRAGEAHPQPVHDRRQAERLARAIWHRYQPGAAVLDLWEADELGDMHYRGAIYRPWAAEGENPRGERAGGEPGVTLAGTRGEDLLGNGAHPERGGAHLHPGPGAGVGPTGLRGGPTKRRHRQSGHK